MKMDPIAVDKLENISEQYNTYIIDVYGVIFDGVCFIKSAIDAVTELYKNSHNNVLLLSNSSRSSNSMRRKLISLDINNNYQKFLTSVNICTSGDVLVEYFMNNAKNNINGVVHHKLSIIGNSSSAYDIINEINSILRDQKLNTLILTDNLNDADSIVLLANTNKDDLVNKNKILNTLQEAAKLKLPCLCPNADIIAPHGKNLVYCSGYYAQHYMKMNQNVIFFGKPYKEIYNTAFNRLKIKNSNDARNNDIAELENNRILAIGDNMANDIVGAHNIGIDSLLIGEEYKITSFNKGEKVKIIPNYIMHMLK